MDQLELIRPYSFQQTITIPGNQFESTCTIDIWKKFQPEVTLPYLNLRRAKVLLSATRTFPPNCEIFFSYTESDKWVVYFCFAPNCNLFNNLFGAKFNSSAILALFQTLVAKMKWN